MTNQLNLFNVSGAASIMGRKGGQSTSAAKATAARANGSLGGRPKSAITFNPDGISIAGCSIIYAPAGQAEEYAALATNPYRGCGHACAYCYVPNVLRMSRQDFDAGATPRPDFIERLRRDADLYRKASVTEQVLMSFTTDVFNPFDMSLTIPAIEVLIQHGLAFCTLTKGGSRAMTAIDLFRPERDAFATTLTSLDDSFSQKWERGAALPGDRIETLKRFHERGVFTWVSLEPTLDVVPSLSIIERTHGFVDLYKVGRANYLPMTTTTDWEDYTHRVIDLCAKVGARHYIKRDLQGFLPPGYHNPLRVPQHH